MMHRQEKCLSSDVLTCHQGFLYVQTLISNQYIVHYVILSSQHLSEGHMIHGLMLDY